MNAKRFIAPDMRRALTLVRQELGDNAVILQNKTIPEGVELIATNEEVGTVFRSLQTRPTAPAAPAVAPEVRNTPTNALDDVLPKGMVLPPVAQEEQASEREDKKNALAQSGALNRGRLEERIDQKAQKIGARLLNKALQKPQPATSTTRDNAQRSDATGSVRDDSGDGVSVALGQQKGFGDLLGALVNAEPVRYAPKKKESSGGFLPADQVAQIREAVAENYTVVIDTLKEEVDLLRRLLTTQAAEQRWEQFSCTQPLKAHLLQQLIGAGYLPNLARRWVDALSSPEDLKSAWKALLKMMLSALPTAPEGIFAHNEAVALVGPTGAGKTSTIGKLAAAFVLNGKAQDLAIISTDAYRIGAQDQLRTLCQIIGVPLTVVDDHLSLRRALARYAGRRKVLVDTAGLTQQDAAWQLQLQELESCRQSIASYMVVSTTNQLAVHVKALQDYASLPLSGCILTKLDECGRLGDSLSAVIQAQLPIAFTTSGMRIPEDLACADALSLIKQSLAGSVGDCLDPLLAQSCFEQVQSHGVRGASKGVDSLLNVCGL